MAKIPYFPFYPDDWLSSSRIDTMTADQERGYFRLLCRSWGMPGCTLPDDNGHLSRWSLLSDANALRTVMRTFFERTEKGWRNPKLYGLWMKAQEKHTKAVKSANSLWKKKKGLCEGISERNANAEQTQSVGNANQNQNQKKHMSKPPANPSVRVLLEHLKSAFEKKTGSPPVMSYPGISKQLKILLEQEKFTEDALKEMVDWYLTSPKFKDHPTPAAAISADTVQRWQVACPEDPQ
jgi:uncharacterized protein YdaU (DUF1376 family)